VLAGAWREENLLQPRRDAAVLWLRRLEQSGLAPATVQVCLAAARALYGALRWAGATQDDPFTGSRPARDPTPTWEKRAPYSEAELAALVRKAEGSDLLLVLLAGHAGLRVSECLALCWRDISLPHKELTVQHGKGGRRRTVPLSASLAGALQRHLPSPYDAEGYVLPYRSDFPARTRLKAVAEAAGVPYRGIHALRHACGTRLVRATNGNLGHGSLETARIYAKWSDQTVRSALEAW
jgi:integrase